MALAALIISIVAALIALASAAYARRQAVATETAAAIESKRLHDELTPELTVRGKERPGTRLADMTVELTGPPGLDGLDEVTIRIRDAIPDRKPRPGSDLTQKQIAAVIWGPYRLNPGERNTDPAGRTDRSGCPSTSRTPFSSSRPCRHPGARQASGRTSTKASLPGSR